MLHFVRRTSLHRAIFDAKRKHRGFSLLETLLALSIGAIVFASSIGGFQKYTEGVKVQASAAQLEKLRRAADLYAGDNFADLVANAPQQLPISVLAAYVAPNIGEDAFGNSFVLSTRTYTYPVPDPAGGTRNEQALQVMVVGIKGPATLDDDPLLRAKIANTAGDGAGFISNGEMSCINALGAVRTDDQICGAHGAYSMQAARFPATDFTTASVVALVTTGDSAAYGDELMRYDYGDPELNTMHTDLFMDGKEIQNVAALSGLNRIDMGSARSIIRENVGDLEIGAADSIILDADTGEVLILPNDGGEARLRSDNGSLHIGGTTDRLVLGDEVTDTVSGATALRGTGRLLADRVDATTVAAAGVRSRTGLIVDPLRLQHFSRGEVIIGSRVQYTPPIGLGANPVTAPYELGNGQLFAGHVRAQDITCADCGGSLSEILPKWRHMGTYYVPNTAVHLVPVPNCTSTRRDTMVRGANEVGAAYQETSDQDPRHIPKIIIVPKSNAPSSQASFIAANETSASPFNWSATMNGVNWEVTNAKIRQGTATALAMTYCVFTGGAAPAPDSAVVPNLGAGVKVFLD
jgi:prepilin-type N-terminal cleavage/methylation domain-containing protein